MNPGNSILIPLPPVLSICKAGKKPFSDPVPHYPARKKSKGICNDIQVAEVAAIRTHRLEYFHKGAPCKNDKKGQELPDFS